MAVAIGVVLITVSLVSYAIIQVSNRPRRLMTLSPAMCGTILIFVALVKMRRRAKQFSLRNLLLRSNLLVVMTVLMQIPSSAITAKAISQALQNAGFAHASIGSLVPLLVSMLCVHLVASIIVPWSLFESAVPIVAICAVGVAAAPFAPDSFGMVIGGLAVVALMGVPGMIVSWLRFSGLRRVVEVRWLAGRYNEVQRELAFARRLHERLFAKPITDGAVRFDYRYEPMSEIGGDFVDVLREPGGAVTFILVDVTGHGVAAALAVNRLHGEIKRVVAAGDAASGGSDPSRLPLQIIAALNAYVSLTLSDESVFATALAVRVDPVSAELTWCNAGHPPAFVRRSGGEIVTLDSTAMMLGPLSPELYDAELGSMPFHPADQLIAYTDGAIEGRNQRDDELGIEGLRSIVGRADSRAILEDVWNGIRRFRHGPAEDDVLVLLVSHGQTTPTHEAMPDRSHVSSARHDPSRS
jgi:serine phosphatase RsbU (regulator of sigma subunit)